MAASPKLLHLFALLSILATVCALECYKCHGKSCMDPLNVEDDGLSKIMNLLGKPCKACIKIKIAEDAAVTRGCLTDSREDMCMDEVSSRRCYCSTNLCNGAPEATPVSMLLLGISATAILILIRQ